MDWATAESHFTCTLSKSSYHVCWHISHNALLLLRQLHASQRNTCHEWPKSIVLGVQRRLGYCTTEVLPGCRLLIVQYIYWTVDVSALV